MIFWVYVDYLNVFHQVSTHYKEFWIDYEKLILRQLQKKFPEAKIGKIYIYYSMLSGSAGTNQNYHIKAMKMCSKNIKFVQGHYKSVSKTGKVYNPFDLIDRIVKIKTKEEKHTDVNMSCQILYDAVFNVDKFDYQAVVTNDSDFAGPLAFKRMLKQETVLIPPIPEASDGYKPKSIAVDLRRLTKVENRIPSIPLIDMQECSFPDKFRNINKPSVESWLNNSTKQEIEVLKNRLYSRNKHGRQVVLTYSIS